MYRRHVAVTGNPRCEVPMHALKSAVVLGALALLLGGCRDESKIPEQATVGPNPMLPAANKSLIPTVHIAPAKGWSAGAKPTTADDLSASAFATGLDHPRWLYVLPNGDVLVAETNAPPRPDHARGIRGWIFGLIQKRAGAA